MARKAFITTGAEYGCMADGGAGLDKEIKEFLVKRYGEYIDIFENPLRKYKTL